MHSTQSPPVESSYSIKQTGHLDAVVAAAVVADEVEDDIESVPSLTMPAAAIDDEDENEENVNEVDEYVSVIDTDVDNAAALTAEEEEEEEEAEAVDDEVSKAGFSGRGALKRKISSPSNALVIRSSSSLVPSQKSFITSCAIFTKRERQ